MLKHKAAWRQRKADRGLSGFETHNSQSYRNLAVQNKSWDGQILRSCVETAGLGYIKDMTFFLPFQDFCHFVQKENPVRLDGYKAQ